MSGNDLDIQVHIVKTPCRECFVQLSLQGGAVFMDLEKIESYEGNTLRMCRISFDGYGCCSAKGDDMPAVDAGVLRNMKHRQETDGVTDEDLAKVSNILERYLAKNKHHVWEDALLEHGLIKEA